MKYLKFPLIFFMINISTGCFAEDLSQSKNEPDYSETQWRTFYGKKSVDYLPEYWATYYTDKNIKECQKPNAISAADGKSPLPMKEYREFIAEERDGG
ncbi:hypothetical protein, partial [Actinobacillus vicugnae]|uniref:hypothetical protein n=1 Tax=Actinobacillus vicugnae TaxID=2573093 RepID=UPI001242F293